MTVIGIAPAAAAQGSGTSAHAPKQPAPDIIEVTAQLLRFWDAAGAPIAVVQYLLDAGMPVDASGRPIVAATMTLRLMGPGPVRDSSWDQPLDVARGRSIGRAAAGYLVVPLASSVTSWSLTAAYPGSVDPSSSQSLLLPPLPPGSIVLSDLAFGVPESANVWQSGTQRVLLEPSARFVRKAPVHLFYQTRSEARHDSVTTFIVCTDITNPKVGNRVLQISFPGRLDAGINVAERELDMSRMKPGRYQVEVNVSDAQGRGAAWQLGTFTVK